MLQSEHARASALGGRLISCLCEQLCALAEKNEITLAVPMESRIKPLSSIIEKSKRKGAVRPKLDDVSDFIGIRMILLFKSDLIKMDKLIRKHLDVIEYENTSDRLSDNQFGYQSNHYDVMLPKSWLDLPNYSDLGKLKAEIQVRTLAQHMWAAISHKLQYKREDSVPVPVRRAINRASALLETVDLEFDRVLAERGEYAQNAAKNDQDVAQLNVDSLAVIMSEILPQKNKSQNEPYDEILREVQSLGVLDSANLEKILRNHLDEVLNEEKSHVSIHSSDDAERAARGVYFTHCGLMRNALRFEFGDDKVDKLLEED